MTEGSRSQRLSPRPHGRFRLILLPAIASCLFGFSTPAQEPPPPTAPPNGSPAPSPLAAPAPPSASPAPIAATPIPAATPTPGATPIPAAAAMPASAPSPVPPGVAKAEPSPTPPGSSQNALVNGLNPGELQEAINLLRANYLQPQEVDDPSLARATLLGLLSRLDHGAMLLPKPTAENAAPPDQTPDAFRAEFLGARIAYARLGALSRDHLGELDKALKNFNDKGISALILDLRATAASSDYELAADVIRRFVAKGKPLFTLRKPSNNQERLFTSNGDPAYTGPLFIAVDGDTAGAAETIAAVIRFYDQSLIVGTNTAGQAVEYAPLRLSGGEILRVAVSQVLLPANLSIFPGGVKPDLAVTMPAAEKQAIFAASLDKGMAPFVFDSERPHFNEAALVSGVNPELDAARDAQAARRRGDPMPKPPLRDPVIQRSLDLATAITTFQAKPTEH